MGELVQLAELNKTEAYELGWRQGVAFERKRCAELAAGQPLYPDTQTGKRQQWVKEQIAEKIQDGRTP